jgi:tRNA C32,U32 (ribose-2'-O)-methylase TrmJ
MGSERKGLPAALQATCTALVRLPMRSRCDLLNLAVACGVLLYNNFERNRSASSDVTATQRVASLDSRDQGAPWMRKAVQSRAQAAESTSRTELCSRNKLACA